MALIGNLVVNILAKTAQFDKGMGRVTNRLKRFKRALKPITDITNKIFNTTVRFAKLAAVGIAAATIAIVRHGAQFEKTMSRVLALTGATAKEFDKLRDTAIKLGQETEFSAKQASEGMAFFALAGFKVNEIIKSMPATLSLAAAGQIDLAEASNIAAKIMAGMGIKADELGDTVDILAKAFTTANTNLSQLGEALSFVGPVARASGKSLQETVAAIQLLSNAGIQAERAGTGLRNILARLTGGTPQATRKLQELGVQTLDAGGNMLPLANIIEQMNLALRNLGGRAAQTGKVMNIFGLRAGPAMAVLLQAGGKSLRQFEKNLKDVGGTAARIAGIQLNNLSGDWIRLKSVISSVVISINDRLGPALRFITQRLRELILDRQADILSWIDKLVGKVSLWIKKSGGIASALGKLKDKLVKVLEFAKKAFFVILGFKAIQVAITAIIAMQTAVGLLATSFGKLATAATLAFVAVNRFQSQAEKVKQLKGKLTELKITGFDELFGARATTKGGKAIPGGGIIGRHLDRLGAALNIEEVEGPGFVNVKSREERVARIETNRILTEINNTLKDNQAFAE